MPWRKLPCVDVQIRSMARNPLKLNGTRSRVDTGFARLDGRRYQHIQRTSVIV
jgi:hypothetical protein